MSYHFFIQKLYIPLILILLFSTTCAHANDSHVEDKLFSNQLCLGVKFAQGQPLKDLELLKTLGVKWVREEIAWSRMEPRKGTFKVFPESLKARLAFYKQNDIGVIFIIAYENNVAYKNTAQRPNNFVNPVAFARYAQYMARQLKASGVKFVIELWNEPHNSTFAKKEHLGGIWNGAPPSPWVDHYVKMVTMAVKKIKDFDPSITVITDDDMWVVHYHFLEKGLPKALDGFAVHPYVKGPPEIAAVAHDTDWTRPYQVVDKDRSFESAVRRLKEQGVKKMGKQPSIWVTEWGYRVGGNTAAGKMSASKVALYLPRAYVLAEAAGVETTCWFSAMDGPDGEFGLTTNSGKKRPAFMAYKKLSDQLSQSTYQCELETKDANKRAFLFKKGGHWLKASWSLKGKSFYDESVVYESITDNNVMNLCK